MIALSIESIESQQSRKPGRPKKNTIENKLVLRVDLEPELQQDFFKIKEEQGLTNNTEVLRFCIHEFASNQIIRVSPDILHIIRELIEDPRIRTKYFISSVNDFFDRALHLFLTKVNSDRSNLHDVTFRMSLDDESRDIANTLIDIQAGNPSWGATFDEITQSLPNYDPNKIKIILTKFISQKLVREMPFKGVSYFFTPDRSFITEKPVGEL